ncbi:MAG: hypothetical protein MMC23_003146 [Stictis urceolatum]|nr:hypothetical protein [Stictis urceolata]
MPPLPPPPNPTPATSPSASPTTPNAYQDAPSRSLAYSGHNRYLERVGALYTTTRIRPDPAPASIYGTSNTNNNRNRNLRPVPHSISQRPYASIDALLSSGPSPSPGHSAHETPPRWAAGWHLAIVDPASHQAKCQQHWEAAARDARSPDSRTAKTFHELRENPGRVDVGWGPARVVGEGLPSEEERLEERLRRGERLDVGAALRWAEGGGESGDEDEDEVDRASVRAVAGSRPRSLVQGAEVECLPSSSLCSSAAAAAAAAAARAATSSTRPPNTTPATTTLRSCSPASPPSPGAIRAAGAAAAGIGTGTDAATISSARTTATPSPATASPPTFARLSEACNFDGPFTAGMYLDMRVPRVPRYPRKSRA